MKTAALLAITVLTATPMVAHAQVPSLQARFDAASTAAAEDRCDEAVSLFTALEAEGAGKKGSIVGAAIALRKGICLSGLGGTKKESPASFAASHRSPLQDRRFASTR